MVVDRHPDRLGLAEKIGAIAIDDSKGSPVDQVLEQTGGLGVVGCSCPRTRTAPTSWPSRARSP